MPKLLTPAAIARLKPDPMRVREIPDAGAHGLRLAVQPTGRMSWIVRGRRPDGRQMKLTLGALDTSSDDGEVVLGAPLSPRSARILANQLLRERAKGVDIAELPKKKRASGDSFAQVATDFVSDHCMALRGWRITAKYLGLRYPSGEDPVLIPNGLARRWANKQLAEIDGDMVHHAIDEARRTAIPGVRPRTIGTSDARGRAMAAALGKLFSWAARHRRVKVNAALGMYRPQSPPSRSRVLSVNEIRQLWAACTELGYPFGHCIMLMLLTGQRRSECAGMRWSELNEDLSAWSLPPARTKNKKPHAVYLPPLAREIIASVPRTADCGFVFTTNGNVAISGFSKTKARIDLLMGVDDWRLHDLRRTAVTHMAELGVLPHVIEAVVNHVSGHKSGVAGIYNKAVYAQERRAALETWADHVRVIGAS